MKFTHLDDDARARMVDISEKECVSRRARAQGHVRVSERTLRLISEKGLPKGNPFEVARIAGIQAAKETARLIPLCHPIALEHADVQIVSESDGFRITSEVRSRGATGVEMEALTAVSVAALTLYDMCKAVDSRIEIGEIRLIEKVKEASSSRSSG